MEQTLVALLALGLGANLDSVAARFPNSQRVGDYLYVSPGDSRDHISGIALSGSGPSRRLRVSFEQKSKGDVPVYPTCTEVESKIVHQLGPPNVVRKFSEEASERADRVWQRKDEELTLICFRGPRGKLLAEAVVMVPRAGEER